MRPHQHRSDCMPLIFSPVGSLCCILAAPEAHSVVGPATSPILVILGDPFFLNAHIFKSSSLPHHLCHVDGASYNFSGP